jgi:DNA polymerase-3 subunit epsilon
MRGDQEDWTNREDCLDTLYEVKQVVETANWVTFDSETTSLDGQIIQWAVCAPDGTVLSSGYVRPTEEITEGARAVHGISDELLADKPTFDEIADQIWALIDGKTVVIYNADFDISRLYTSLSPYADWRDPENPWTKRQRWLLYDVKRYCAMGAFATIYGEVHSYFRSYTWQTLGTACAYFDIDLDQAHDAAGDAQATARLLQKLYELALETLPEGYHPAQYEPCAGGCGEMSAVSYRYDEDHTWYCLECKLVAGLSHLCSRCEEKGKRTIVLDFSNPPHHAPRSADQLCYECEYETSLASGRWHLCLCSRLVQASIEEQEWCSTCEQKRKKQPYAFRVKGIKWQEHQTTKTDEGFTCSVCLQAWEKEPRGRECPGVPLYIGWKAIPEGLFTMTQLTREHRMFTDWHQPVACVKTFFRKRYEYHELYALSGCQPIPGSPRRRKKEVEEPVS